MNKIWVMAYFKVWNTVKETLSAGFFKKVVPRVSDYIRSNMPER